MLIAYGMPELSLLQSLSTLLSIALLQSSSTSLSIALLQSLSTLLSIALFSLSILDTTLSEEHITFSCDTMSVSLLISVLQLVLSLLLSFLGRV